MSAPAERAGSIRASGIAMAWNAHVVALNARRITRDQFCEFAAYNRDEIDDVLREYVALLWQSEKGRR